MCKTQSCLYVQVSHYSSLGFQLSLAMAAGHDTADSIRVSKLPKDATEDELCLFFENRRKCGGGEIKTFRFIQEKGTRAAVITYDDHTAVQRVLQKLPLVFKGKQIVVEPLFEVGNINNNANGAGIDVGGVIKITGLKATTLLQNVEKYFETKSSTDLPIVSVIEDYEENERIIYIVYRHANDVKSVLSVQHTLEGAKLNVKEFITSLPEVYDRKLLIKGVNKNTTKDGLENFLEAKSGVTATDFIYGKDGTVLVTFEEEPDIRKLRSNCKKRSLEGNYLYVYQVPVSRCVLVSDISPSTSKDAVELYFDNKRKVGSEVERVEFLTDGGGCLVYFEDPEGIEEFCKRKHIVDKSTWNVEVYYHILHGDQAIDAKQQKASCDKTQETLMVACKWRIKNKEKEIWNTPSQRVIYVSSKSEKLAWKFMLANKQLYQNMSTTLNPYGTEVSFDKEYDVIKVRCNQILNTEEMVDSWWNNLLCVMKQGVALVKIYHVKCADDIQTLLQSLRVSSLVKSELISVDDTEEDGFIVMGLLESVSKLIQENMKEFQACNVTDMIDDKVVACQEVKMKEEQMKLMKKFACEKIIQDRFKNVWASVNEESCLIFVSGPENYLKQIKTILESADWLASLVSCKEIELEDSYFLLFPHTSTRSYVDKKLKSNHFGVFILDFKERLLVYGENPKVASDVENEVKQCFDNYCILVKNPRNWKNRAAELMQKYAGRLSIHFPPSKGNEIQISGTDDIFRESDVTSYIAEITGDALDDNRIITFSYDELSLLDSTAFTQIESFSTKLKVFLFSPTAGDKSTLLLRGPVSGIHKTTSYVKEMLIAKKKQFKGAQMRVTRPADGSTPADDA